MIAASPFVAPPSEPDRRFVLYGVSWEAYETLRHAFDEEQAGVRMTYLEGTLELIRPSPAHEVLAKLLARLIEAYAEERDLDLNGYKSTTFRREAKARGLEPDECYSLGALREVPDLAIEIVVSSGLVDKLEVYLGLGVPEVWVHKDGAMTVYRLADGAYRTQPTSELLPTLDLAHLAGFVRVDAKQTATVKAYRAALRSRA